MVSLNPVVRILRNPVAERLAEALLLSRECFICGSGSAPPTTSDYVDQVMIFQRLLKGQHQTPANYGNNCCSTCLLQSVREVCELRQLVRRIQDKINNILGKAGQLIKSRVGAAQIDVEIDHVFTPPSSPLQIEDNACSPPLCSDTKFSLGEIIHPQQDDDSRTATESDITEREDDVDIMIMTKEKPSPHKSKWATLKCSKCFKTYKNKAAFHFHQVTTCKIPQNSGVKIKILSCPYSGCTKKFYAKVDLKNHLLLHTNPEQLKCSKCSKVLSTRACCLAHEVIVCKVPHDEDELAKNGVKIWDCPEPGCALRFSCKSGLTNHTTIHINPFKCSQCSKPLCSKKSWLIHEVLVCKIPHTEEELAENKIILEACRILGCGKKFPSKPALQTHMRSHTGEQPFKCPHCSTGFTMKHARDLHFYTVCGGKSNPPDPKWVEKGRRIAERNSSYHLVCRLPLCSRRFSNQAQMDAHILKVHGDSTKGDAVICPLCGQTLARCSYRAHLRRMHEQGVKLNCPKKCGKVFWIPKDLKRHQVKCSGMATSTSTKKRKMRSLPVLKECPQCGDKFHHLQSLQKHMKTHE